MYIVSPHETPLSPSSMRFERWWIYDLSQFHSFWKKKVEADPEVASGTSIWEALLNAYGINLFSATESLMPFAHDFHKHYKNKISPKNIEDTFKILSHLGLQKVGHLRRFETAPLQKRFGKAWATFFKGVITPEEAPWIWEPYKKQEPLLWEYEFEQDCIDALWIQREVVNGLEALANQHPLFGIQKIRVRLLLSEVTEETTFDFDFTYRPFLKRDLKWILRLMEERLLHLTLPYPVWKIFIHVFPSESPRSLQLTLFESMGETLAIQELYERLMDQDFNVFKPESTASYLPEDSWKKVPPIRASHLSSHGLFRPLIQTAPSHIPPPEGSLWFTERLQWFDEQGEWHQRDYFIARGDRKWIWIFKNEKGDWFRQGVVE